MKIYVEKWFFNLPDYIIRKKLTADIQLAKLKRFLGKLSEQ